MTSSVAEDVPAASGTTPEQPATSEPALRAAKPPVGTGLSPLFSQLVAVLLIAIGVLGVQEAVHRVGLAGTSWMGWLLAHASGQTATFATLVVSVLLSLAGLTLLVVVFRPRPRRALRLTAATGVYLRTGDLARLARNRIDGLRGVTDVDADATRTRLSVRVSTITPASGNAGLEEEVRSRLTPLSEALEHSPRVTVHIINQDLT